MTGGVGADVVVEAAGSARAFEEGVRLARNGGAYVIAGHYTNVGDSTINAHEHINRKHLDIRGCWGSEVGHFLRALSILERHLPRPSSIGARRHALHQLRPTPRRRRSRCKIPGAGRSVAVTPDQDYRHARARIVGRAVLEALVVAGVDVFRLNFSHGTHESHGRALQRASGQAAQRVPGGTSPSCRISAARRSAPAASRAASRSHLRKGDELRLAASATQEGGPGRSSPWHAELTASAQPGTASAGRWKIELRSSGADG